MKVQDDILDSSCEWDGEHNEYRYVLRRVWDTSKPKIVFIGLNPSVGSEELDDPTIRRCISYARKHGFGSYTMLNAFSYRSTDPRVLKSNRVNVVGSRNNDWILRECSDASVIVAAWGSHVNDVPSRQTFLLELLGDKKLWCFSINKDGTPKHPLYTSGSAPLILFHDALSLNS